MKTKKEFMLREVSDNFFVVPVGQAAVDFNGIITLTETGAFLWKLLQSDTTVEQLVAALRADYDISVAVATEDTLAFIKTLEDANLLDK